MKLCRAFVFLFLFASFADAFFKPSVGRRSLELASKINTKVELENPKVVTMTQLAPGEKKVFCRCWQSGTFPLCDGAHMKHNEATGDNVGPLIISNPKPSK
ncbi:hypothetical protein NSK_001093 [Nannochloropsis salina CCMP1776]|uniref:Iron-binding zinc finger CDGSH type domain-containing protein n=1 Tax=Nannochloropsis salina CCMP1776 TaxID=1027361 RepID=A0A4D9DCC5_9STRA|nr:hypothetical protein NSK_001093 [Nannochloropsis salina CCMP1776]|eukprot:TFJ87743.1 hypothetical protein NSK_001093 [Nannochloropsis salina CCMP1776]